LSNDGNNSNNNNNNNTAIRQKKEMTRKRGQIAVQSLSDIYVGSTGCGGAKSISPRAKRQPKRAHAIVAPDWTLNRRRVTSDWLTPTGQSDRRRNKHRTSDFI